MINIFRGQMWVRKVGVARFTFDQSEKNVGKILKVVKKSGQKPGFVEKSGHEKIAKLD